MGLSDDILTAMKAVEKAKPRNMQIKLGPRDLGSCREYIRNVMVGAPMKGGDEWPAAAVMGTLAGDYMEYAAQTQMGARVQVPITTQLPNGLLVSGTADMIFEDRNALADCKTKDGLADIQRYGAKLDNLIQVSVYTLGCVQNGYLKEGATAHLVYLDRSGGEQTLYEIVLEWDDILMYVDQCVDRLDEVIEAQKHIDAGEVEWARALRDKTPPFCYSEKVLCPFRDLCWEGSEWVPDETIEDEETIEDVRRYAAARQEKAEATSVMEEYRERLIGVTGVTPDGWSVVWPANGRALYVTKVRR